MGGGLLRAAFRNRQLCSFPDRLSEPGSDSCSAMMDGAGSGERAGSLTSAESLRKAPENSSRFKKEESLRLLRRR